MLAWAAAAAVRVTTLDAGDARIEELRSQLVELDSKLALTAARMSILRRRAAAQLEPAGRRRAHRAGDAESHASASN